MSEVDWTILELFGILQILIDGQVEESRKSHHKRKAITAGSLKLRLITAQRGGEVMSMRWDEIAGDWRTIPARQDKEWTDTQSTLNAIRVENH